MTAKKVWGTIIIVFGIIFVIYGAIEFYSVYNQSVMLDTLIRLSDEPISINQTAAKKIEKEFMIAYILKTMIILFGVLLSLIGTKLISTKS